MGNARFHENSYPPVEEWVQAPDHYKNLGLNNGEYTIITDLRTGRGIYVVARVEDIIRYCVYMDGNLHVEGFQKVALKKISWCL